MQGTILREIVPATIMRSACLGEGRATPNPKRSRSNREAPPAINSIAQQASPKVNGHKELARAMSKTSSTLKKLARPATGEGDWVSVVREVLFISMKKVLFSPPNGAADLSTIRDVWTDPTRFVAGRQPLFPFKKSFLPGIENRQRQ